MDIITCLNIGIIGTVAILFILYSICFFFYNVTYKLYKKILGTTNDDCPPFIVSDYLSKIEQENVKILEEREKQPKYIITLWLGLDGLRMNEDGTYEWVSRKKEAEVKTTTPTQKISDIVFLQKALKANLYGQAVQIPALPYPLATAGLYKQPPMPYYTSYTKYQQSFLPYGTYHQINQCMIQQLQQTNQSIQMQTDQIDSNMRLIEMLSSQQTFNLRDQQQNMC